VTKISVLTIKWDAVSRPCKYCVLGLLALPILYVMSYGPACSLFARQAIPAETYFLYRFIPRPVKTGYIWILCRYDRAVANYFASGGEHY
jgi:hypothetical protein